MELKTPYFAFTILESEIENTYHGLRLTTFKILNLVQNEINIKGIYNPEIHTIIKSEDNEKFESFQEILRNLNNVVYYNSLLLSSFSIFEMALKQLCLFVEEYSSPRLAFTHPNREILKRCRGYLADSGLVNLSITNIDSKYVSICELNKLRNLIAHYNGNLIQERKKDLVLQKDYKVFKSHKYLTIMNNGQVYINNANYIKDFIDDCQEFIRLIILELKK